MHWPGGQDKLRGAMTQSSFCESVVSSIRRCLFGQLGQHRCCRSVSGARGMPHAVRGIDHYPAQDHDATSKGDELMLLPVEVDGICVYVEVVQAGGAEPTSTARRGAERAADLLSDAQTVIEHMAVAVMETGRRISTRAGSPDLLEIQFGLKFSAKGNIIVAGASSEASLTVKLVYGTNLPLSVSESNEPGDADDEEKVAA